MKPEYIEIVRRYRTWASVHPDDRADEELIKHVRPWSSSYTEEDMARLRDPKCIVAIQPPDLRGKWMPCRLQVKPGADRCYTHGGPSSAKTPKWEPQQSKKQLQREIERLRAELAKQES